MPATDAANRSTGTWLALAVAIALAIAVGFFRGSHFENAQAGIGLADGYWTQFWLTTYSDGFLRRSLLGSLTALVIAPGTDVTVLSVIQFSISASLLAVSMTVAYVVMNRLASPAAALASSALLGFSPIGPMLFETTGDPMQSAVLVWIAAAVVSSRWNEAARLFLLVPTLGVTVLIHEASVFFVIPHLLLTAPGIRSVSFVPRTILTGMVVCVVAAAIGFLTSHSAGTPRFHVTNSLDGSPIFADRLATPGFLELLKTELHNSFSTVGETIRWVGRIACFLTVPACIIGFMATFDRRMILLAPLTLAWIACSSPLYLIAHDWGRFGALTLVFVLVTSLADAERINLGRLGERALLVWSAVSRRIIRSERDLAIVRIVLAAVVLASTVIWLDYRIFGGRVSAVLAIPAILLAAYAYFRPEPQAQGQDQPVRP